MSMQSNSEAITSGVNIIITTLQKFPFALNHLTTIPNRNYAVIIDEAHSSQGGEASRKMTEALVGKNVSLEESEKVEAEIEHSVEDEDDYVREVILKRGPQKKHQSFCLHSNTESKNAGSVRSKRLRRQTTTLPPVFYATGH